MEPKLPETEASGRKRTHTEFAGDVEDPSSDAYINASTSVSAPVSQDSAQPPAAGSAAVDDPARSSQAPSSPRPPLSPSDATTPKRPADKKQSVSPSAAASKTTTPAGKPAAKRKRLTADEKEARDRELAEKKREKEAQAALRAAEKAKQEETKAARAKDREEKRKKKEEEDEAKAERKRQKEEEQRRVLEEKEKKARSQTKLNFHSLSKTPKKAVSTSSSLAKPDSTEAVSEPEVSAYDGLFKPFFVHENVRWPRAMVPMDEATQKTKSDDLDEYISGRREPKENLGPLDAIELLGLHSKPPKRGRLHHPVRHIMEKCFEEATRSGNDITVAERNVELVRERLAKIPLKIISFHQDVRPPYCGTITFVPQGMGMGNMYRLARKTTDKRIPGIDYGYDSEAEWQDEEGEDVDVDDDDEEQDDEDDMDGFLDDSEDAGLSRRVFAKTMEPISSGISFENEAGRASNSDLSRFKMEFMHAGLKQDWGIDPFSPDYWESEEKRRSPKTGNTAKGASKMAPSKTPVTNALNALRDGEDKAVTKMVKAEHLDEVKRLILQYRDVSKTAIIEVILHEFRSKQGSVSRAEVKNTVEKIAEKKGRQDWILRPGYEIKL
ncbi:hypothetical protein CP532_1482 [Ophiocordyceps camponoti-leonardi (nom. inval.)]|nr:hypothetical protein CP532_1482 [Ophiocordyceps camponoti-leonardi (nom. inval.)]